MGREFLVSPEGIEPVRNASGTSVRYLMGENNEGQWVHLVECAPGQIIEAHSHDVDQFQIVISGSASYAGIPTTPGTVHFAEKNTPYGPIVAGPDGLTFMVIRPNTSARAAVAYSSTKIRKVKESQQTLAADQRVDPPR